MDCLLLQKFNPYSLFLENILTAKIWPYHSKEHCGENILSRVLVGGCFDVLHFGHIKFLQAAKGLGHLLTIALEPDEKILQNKNRRPIHTQLQRAEILSHLRPVDEIILLPFMSGYEEYLLLIQQLKPNYIAVTEGDPQLNNKQKQAAAIAAELVVVTHHITTFSSSHLIKEALGQSPA